MHDESSRRPAVTGQGDELDRGTGAATSGGGLGKAMKPKIDDTIDENVERDSAAEKAAIVRDDELLRPPEDRSPLT